MPTCVWDEVFLGKKSTTITADSISKCHPGSSFLISVFGMKYVEGDVIYCFMDLSTNLNRAGRKETNMHIRSISEREKEEFQNQYKLLYVSVFPVLEHIKEEQKWIS